jgi:hypothetical protein
MDQYSVRKAFSVFAFVTPNPNETMNPSSFPQSSQSFPEDAQPESGSSTSLAEHNRGGIKQAVRSAAENVRAKVSETASTLKSKASDAVQEQKRAAADRVGGYSSAIHETADSLEEKDPNIAWFTRRAAERLQGVADYVRDRDFRSLKTDVEDLARRHPVAFFGGLFIAGLIVGNIVKATGKSAPDDQFAEEEPGNFVPDQSYAEEAAQPYTPPTGETVSEPMVTQSSSTPSPAPNISPIQ